MRILHTITARIFSDELLRHISILFSGMMVVHVCNMVFQMAVSRALPGAEYTLLMAFFAVIAIIQRPLSTLATGVAHYSSLMRLEGRVGDVKRLLRKWLLVTGIVAVVLGVAVVACNKSLSGFLHLERVAPVIIAGALLPALFCSPVLAGAGQGLQLFGWCSISTILGALIRLGLGAGLVWFWVPACGWAMFGHGLGLYASAVVLSVALLLMLHRHKKSEEILPSMRFYLLQSFFIQAAYAVLMTADVVLVKHYFPENTEFAYAATLGRMVVFLPGAIVTAMFPKVVSRGVGSKEQYRVFLRSFGYTALCVVASVVGCILFSGLLTRIIFGIINVSAELKQMIGLMSLVMGVSALLNVTVQFLLAQRRFVPAFSVVGFALMYLLGVVLFHETTSQVVFFSAFGNFGALFMGLFAILRIKMKGEHAPREDTSVNAV